ncbi:D-isomer specific 2-hydroxyacid dehydrogenase, NAD-binding [Penicillium griseofulvum]|uniref:D-isomer specific 2-hydroxyacid dehydrogenase, NAD-binding n=1 Tax=Penicillium patulum TaxID=5078 RepID=A0A135LT17_PENPA|nr:D-isomer specific 2-hydroxyacid dehydrogenase, NAD-binding [Penicillium griseofulvum]KXG52100.1 D-isomer specific 2-hydroxyacid dehydrogenase, NAD-binding [Penicillium griseofulvum]
MGDAPISSEHVLVVFYQAMPEELEDVIRQKFSDAEVTIHQSQGGVPVPPELYQTATVLVTFTDLPDLKDSKNLKLIHTFSAGVDHLLKHPILQESNIPITTSSGIHGPPIAEWTVMNWLVTSRKHSLSYEAQKLHVWEDKAPYTKGIHDQVGKKVGILGYGSIGRQIARVSKALGMTVYAYTATPRQTPESRRDTGYIVPGTGDPDGSIPTSWHHGTDRESIHSFLALGLDHLVISLPLTPQTTRLLGAEEFAILSDNSHHHASKPYVTNISRGKVIDQKALVDALNSGILGGAALDVTDPEPLPKDDPLWDAANVQISPHVSGLGMEYLSRSLDILQVNLGRIARGEPLINSYVRGKGY